MGVKIDQMTNDGYFTTQKDHLHLLEGVSKTVCSNTIPYGHVQQLAFFLSTQVILHAWAVKFLFLIAYL